MDSFVGQILPFAIGYAPRNTALAAGQLLPVNQNMALFSLFGIAYGGDGRPGGTFGLPNVAGRSLVGFGNGGAAMPLGGKGGEVTHSLTLAETPQHSHALIATNQGSLDVTPEGMLPGTVSTSTPIYGEPGGLVPLAGAPLASAGGGQPHPNMQPSMPINFAVVLQGIFPQRS